MWLLRDEGEDENILFHQTINSEGTGTVENGNLHRFSPATLFTYSENRDPQFTITQVVSELGGQSLTIYCENDFDIGALFTEWATVIPSPDKPVKPIEPQELGVTRDDFVPGSAGDTAYQQRLDAYNAELAQYQIDLAQYNRDLAEYNAFFMPDVPRGRASYSNDMVGQDAYEAALQAYTDAINTFVAYRKFIFNDRYALYIVNLTTEKLVVLKANVFSFSEADSVTFDSGNWVVLRHNLEDDSDIPDMFNSLNDNRVIVGLLRLDLFRNTE